MTCAICRFFDVCVVRNTEEACTSDKGKDHRKWVFGEFL